MSKEVGVVVDAEVESDPSAEEVEFESTGACFDRMTAAEQAAVIKSVGSVEKIRANPYFNDCKNGDVG
jgi:hypothetical protein